MRRGLKWGLALVVALLALVALNALAISNSTKDARLNVDGARLVETSAGALQLLDEGDSSGPAVVLIHGLACSMRWWDQLAPMLTADHRVIRVDLLGHGGSEKPKQGYSIPDQAAAVTEVLTQLGVSRATVVGHSLGGAVATEIAVRSPELAAAVITIGTPPESGQGEFSTAARLTGVPLIGQALKRIGDIAPRALVRSSFEQAFAPSFSFASGFEDPDQPVEDLRALTYSAYVGSVDGFEKYVEESPISERLAAAGTPTIAVFGAEDQIIDDEGAAAASYDRDASARVVVLDGVGHSANVEAPDRLVPLIDDLVAVAEQLKLVDARREAKQRAQVKRAEARAEAERKAAAAKRKKAAARSSK